MKVVACCHACFICAEFRSFTTGDPIYDAIRRADLHTNHGACLQQALGEGSIIGVCVSKIMLCVCCEPFQCWRLAVCTYFGAIQMLCNSFCMVMPIVLYAMLAGHVPAYLFVGKVTLHGKVVLWKG